jgi:hypothetical protein
VNNHKYLRLRMERKKDSSGESYGGDLLGLPPGWLAYCSSGRRISGFESPVGDL